MYICMCVTYSVDVYLGIPIGHCTVGTGHAIHRRHHLVFLGVVGQLHLPYFDLPAHTHKKPPSSQQHRFIMQTQRSAPQRRGAAQADV